MHGCWRESRTVKKNRQALAPSRLGKCQEGYHIRCLNQLDDERDTFILRHVTLDEPSWPKNSQFATRSHGKSSAFMCVLATDQGYEIRIQRLIGAYRENIENGSDIRARRHEYAYVRVCVRERLFV